MQLHLLTQSHFNFIYILSYFPNALLFWNKSNKSTLEVHTEVFINKISIIAYRVLKTYVYTTSLLLLFFVHDCFKENLYTKKQANEEKIYSTDFCF